MRQQIAKAIILLSLVLGGSSPDMAGAPGADNAQGAVHPTGPPRPFKTPSETEAAAIKALSGDADAAWGLSLHFTREAWDKEQSDYWMRIAAENRNHNALYYYAERLSGSDDFCKLLRSIYFLELAAKFTPASNARSVMGIRKEIDEQKQKVARMPRSNCVQADTLLH